MHKRTRDRDELALGHGELANFRGKIDIGADLGGAVRGFKDGMKSSEDKPAEGGAAPQVTGRTIEGEVKEKAKT